MDEDIFDPADYNPFPFYEQQQDQNSVDRNDIDRQGFFGAGAGGGLGLGLAGALFGFAPFLLSVGGILGAAIGLNIFNSDSSNVDSTNSITFNPNITYEGDNIVSNVTDNDAIMNTNNQMQTNTATNDITNADTNNVNTAVNPINSNANGIFEITEKLGAKITCMRFHSRRCQC